MINLVSIAMNPAYELRVLSGCHTGARAPVHKGALIGAGLDCDIILADDKLPDMAQTIDLSDNGWTLDDGAPLAFNQPAMFGAVWITVALPDKPWPQVPVSTAPKEQPSHDAAPDELAADTRTDVADPAQDTDVAHLSAHEAIVLTADDFHNPIRADHQAYRAAQEKNRRKRFYAAVLVGGVLALASLLAFWQPGVSTAEVDATKSAASSVDTVEQIRLALLEMGYAETVHIVVQDQGPVILRGWVSDAAGKDEISRAMTRIWPMPALQLYVSSEVIADIRGLLAQYPVYHVVRIMHDQIHLEGIVADSEQKAALTEQVKNRYPELTIVTDQLMLAKVVRDRFIRDLHDAGLQDDVPLQWASSYLEVDVSQLDIAQQELVHQLAVAFNNDYWGRARLLGRLILGPDLPFAIRSIVSGPQPYVVLPDGQKVLKGGSHQGFRLTAIEAGRVVFQGNDEIIVQR